MAHQTMMDLNRLREHFETKLSAEKQLADVVDSIRNGDSTLLLVDMRAREDYQRGHIKGALSMPLEEIDKRYRDLPRDKEIVTYCYNQYCHLSTLGALKLVEHGIPAKEMNVGWSEWVRLGNPLHDESEVAANATTIVNLKLRKPSLAVS